MPTEDAEARAEALLRSSLTEDQRQELDARGCFHIEVGERLYRIRRGRAGNIYVVKDREDTNVDIIETLCAHPEIMVPDADTMLAQKLWLEFDEAAFREIANIAQGSTTIEIDPEERRRIIERYLSTPEHRQRFAASFTHPLRLRAEHAAGQGPNVWGTPQQAVQAGLFSGLEAFRESHEAEVRDVITRVEWPEGIEPMTFDDVFPPEPVYQEFENLGEFLEALVEHSADGPLTAVNNPRRLLMGYQINADLVYAVSLHTLRDHYRGEVNVPMWAFGLPYNTPEQRQAVAQRAHEVALERCA